MPDWTGCFAQEFNSSCLFQADFGHQSSAMDTSWQLLPARSTSIANANIFSLAGAGGMHPPGKGLGVWKPQHTPDTFPM